MRDLTPHRPERDRGENQGNPWSRELNPSSGAAQSRLCAFIGNHFNCRFRIAHSSRGQQHSSFFPGLIDPEDAEPEKREQNYRAREGTRPTGNRPTASRAKR